MVSNLILYMLITILTPIVGILFAFNYALHKYHRDKKNLH
jgi:uncharacterized membrane protein